MVVARLALHGETLTRVGRDGIEIPRVGSARMAGRAAPDDTVIPASRLERLLAMVEPSAKPDAQPPMTLSEIVAEMKVELARLQAAIARAEVRRLEEQLHGSGRGDVADCSGACSDGRRRR